MLTTSRSRTVCRFHGARSGAPRGQANGAYRHGLYTAKAAEERRRLRELLDQVRETVAGIIREPYELADLAEKVRTVLDDTDD